MPPTKSLYFADKTRNIYGLNKEQHKKLLRENISKSYKKSDKQSVDMVNQELKDIIATLKEKTLRQKT